MGVVGASYDHPLRIEEKATMPLAGGIANMGYQCGMLWGAALAAGARAFQLYGAGSKAEIAAMNASKKLVDTFQGHSKNEINCLEISDLDMQGDFDSRKILKFFIKGGPIGCFRLAARYAQDVRNEIDAFFVDAPIETSALPVSCASVLAKRMGVSEMHQVMAAGFAGGIGFSGGGCGALAAAIWIAGLKKPVEIEGFSYSGTWVNDGIEIFLEFSDYEFECAAITGRQFESAAEHADYINGGGCAKIIEGLSSKLVK